MAAHSDNRAALVAADQRDGLAFEEAARLRDQVKELRQIELEMG